MGDAAGGQSREHGSGDDDTWDEGLAHYRTELSWGRSGLAVLVASAILVRRVLTIPVAAAVATAVLVAAGAVIWLVGMWWSRRLVAVDDPHGLRGERAFTLVSGGTLLLAGAGLFLGLCYPA
jgi:Domain of unknown function (DUF202)